MNTNGRAISVTVRISQAHVLNFAAAADSMWIRWTVNSGELMLRTGSRTVLFPAGSWQNLESDDFDLQEKP